MGPRGAKGRLGGQAGAVKEASKGNVPGLRETPASMQKLCRDGVIGRFKYMPKAFWDFPRGKESMLEYVISVFQTIPLRKQYWVQSGSVS